MFLVSSVLNLGFIEYYNGVSIALLKICILSLRGLFICVITNSFKYRCVFVRLEPRYWVFIVIVETRLIIFMEV